MDQRYNVPVWLLTTDNELVDRFDCMCSCAEYLEVEPDVVLHSFETGNSIDCLYKVITEQGLEDMHMSAVMPGCYEMHEEEFLA